MKYDFQPGQVWKNTRTGDRFVILAVGPDFVGYKYDTGRGVYLGIRTEIEKGEFTLVRPKIKKYWVAYKYASGDTSVGYYSTKDQADNAATSIYLLARGVLEFEEGDGL